MWHRSEVRCWLAVVVCACGSGDRPAPSPAPVPVAHPRAAPSAGSPAPRGPHGGAIARVAITDEGDAAVTADELGGLRLWPTLDGKEEPRIIAGGAVRRLALAHAGGDLLVAIVDAAGGIELLRFGSDGAPHGHADLPPDPGFDQLVALGAGVLALGRDQTVRSYDATGALRGQLAAEAGERIVAIAARRGGAIATFDTGAAPTVVRAIELAPALHWGPRIALPMAVRALSLSPSHARVAAVKLVGGDGVVIELTAPVHEIGAASLVASRDAKASTGFIDDDHAVFATPERTAWSAAKVDPAGPHVVGMPTELAVGDLLAAAGNEAAVLLVEPERWRYLGYRDLGAGTATELGQHVAINLGSSMIWLDAKLRELRATPEPTGTTEPSSPYLAFDDHLYLSARTVTPAHEPAPRAEVYVTDLDTGTEREVVSLPSLTTVMYDRATRVLGIQAVGEMTRYTIDAHGGAHALRSLRADQGSVVVPLDPKRAHGAIAVALESTSSGEHLLTFREGPPGADALAPATTVAVDGSLLGVTRDGAAYVLRATQIDVYQDGEPSRHIVVNGLGGARAGAVSHDGATVALLAEDVFAVDASGHERWRRSVWRATALLFLDDDRELVVTTQGGFLALDAATGEPIATGCGWRFGLHTEVVGGTLGTQTVCE